MATSRRDWAEDNDTDYIFGLAGNVALDAMVAEIADNLRFHHAMSRRAKLRTFARFMYQASSWKRPRKVVARLECSLQPVAGETGMRQEVDIRYIVTSLAGSPQHLYENIYCQRGQMENLIKLHKAQLASDRMSCHSATANQVRLVLHTAAFWLMHGVRTAIPRTNALACGEFATIRERLIKIGARVIEHIARIRVQLPTSCPEATLFRTVALGLMRSGGLTPIQLVGSLARTRSTDIQKCATWCMIQARLPVPGEARFCASRDSLPDRSSSAKTA
jgi:Transposase DDE domain group 1